MESYVDEKYLIHFLQSLINSERFTEESFDRESMLKYFKCKTDLFIDTDFLNVLNKIEKSKIPVVSNLLNILTTGRNNTIIRTKQSNKFRGLKGVEVYSKFKNPFVSFWLGDRYNHSIEKYSNSNPYYFLSDIDDIEKWKLFSNSKTFYVGPNENQDADDVLNSWDVIKQFAHPFNDFIICDGYCLKDKSGIEENIIPLISKLAINPDSLKNIIFFCKPDKSSNLTLSQVHSILEEGLNKNGIYAKIIIYKSYKTPHDRYMVTNNVFITSGDSFDYFRKNRSFKTRGTTISIAPIYEANKTELNNLAKKLKEISSNENTSFYGETSKNILDLI